MESDVCKHKYCHNVHNWVNDWYCDHCNQWKDQSYFATKRNKPDMLFDVICKKCIHYMNNLWRYGDASDNKQVEVVNNGLDHKYESKLRESRCTVFELREKLDKMKNE